jgi:hypothetical protein
MRALLARHGFAVTRDHDLRTIAAHLSANIDLATQIASHLRIVTADRPR